MTSVNDKSENRNKRAYTQITLGHYGFEAKNSTDGHDDGDQDGESDLPATDRGVQGTLSSRAYPVPEIIEGVIREGQFAVLTAYYNTGKTPLVHDLAFHVCNGRVWLDRPVTKRGVILLDFETSPVDYAENISNLDLRYVGRLNRPDAHLLLATESSEGITPLNGVSGKKWWERINFIRTLLEDSPDALVIIDPAEHFFHFNRNRTTHVLTLFLQLRQLLKAFPHAAMFLVMNLRKRGLRRNPPRLLSEPLQWLEDNAGNLDVLNRCDVRLGFDFHDDPTLRVIHGARRREPMKPIIVRQVGFPDQWCGFERVDLTSTSLQLGLTKRQHTYWRRLPSEFRFEDIVAADIVPRSSLSRLINVARSMGLLVSKDGMHRKL